MILRRLRAFVLLAACSAVPAAAQQDAPVLAEYGTNSGSLPPQYAWETTVVIRTDGSLLLTHCRGYATEGPGCKTRRARVEDAALAAIRAAAAGSGLAERPAREADEVPVGGGITWGRVVLDGAVIDLTWNPHRDDAARVGRVLEAIRAAIPARFGRFVE